jgi:hypothetical protein
MPDMSQFRFVPIADADLFEEFCRDLCEVLPNVKTEFGLV